MTVAELIIRAFATRGIRRSFGIPGSGFLLDLMEAGRRSGVDLVTTANESSAAVAAAYYGRLAGAPGLAVAIQGPGAANLAAGAALAWFERMPVVCLCERPPLGMSHPIAQIADGPSLFAGVVKQSFCLSPDRPVEETVTEAIECAAAARPGPVLLEVPKDCASWPPAEPASPSDAARSGGPEGGTSSLASPERIDSVCDFVERLDRPVLVAGGDVLRSGGARELTRLAKRIGAAVLVATDARGVYPENDPQFAGVFPNLTPPAVLGNRILDLSDGVIFAGVDPLAAEAPWTRELPVCRIAAESSLAFLDPSPAAELYGDLPATLELVEKRLAERRRDAPGASTRGPSEPGFDIGEIARVRDSVGRSFAPADGVFTVQDVLRISRELLPPEGILFSETGVFVLMLEYLWKTDAPDTFFGTAGGRTMGLTIPALLGGKLARPGTPMMGIGGDGSALMRLGELEAFARSGASAPIVIVNDSALGTIKSRQRSRGLPEYGLDLSPVDFAAVASAAGIEGVVVTTEEEFRVALEESFGRERATLIDARIDGETYRASFGPTTGAQDV